MIEYVIPPPQRASLPVSTGAQLTLPRQGDSQTCVQHGVKPRTPCA